MPDSYHHRQWLNPEGHPSTGSVVSYCGQQWWSANKDSQPVAAFLEIADCHGKIRLHDNFHSMDDIENFVDKLNRLSTECLLFAAWVEANRKDLLSK